MYQENREGGKCIVQQNHPGRNNHKVWFMIAFAVVMVLVNWLCWNHLQTVSKLLLIAFSVTMVFVVYAFTFYLNDGLFSSAYGYDSKDKDKNDAISLEQALSIARSWKTLNLAWLIAHWVLSGLPILLSILVIFAANYNYDVNSSAPGQVNNTASVGIQEEESATGTNSEIDVMGTNNRTGNERIIICSAISLAMTAFSFIIRPKEQAYGYRVAYEGLHGKLWLYRNGDCELKDVLDAVDIGERMITGATYDTFVTYLCNNIR